MTFFSSGVQSAAVNVICELARKNPKNYLPLAPVFFKLMTNSTNNWMLIKIIKLVCFVEFIFVFFVLSFWLITFSLCYYFFLTLLLS